LLAISQAFHLIGFGVSGLFFVIDKYRPQLWRPITGSAT
jgi:hypothetical protein